MTHRPVNGARRPVQAGTEGTVTRGERITVGFDGSLASVAALSWASEEARLREMRLHIVYVHDTKAVMPAHYAPPRASHGAADRAGQESALTSLIDDVLGPDVWPAVQLEFADGLPARVLLDRAAGAAMLVLGGRPGSLDASPVGKPRAPLGPVARDCLRAAPCPVVIVTGCIRQHEGGLARAVSRTEGVGDRA
jgi:nucleotide-binding universal stress UspA family protein